uniref:Transmembrane protein n=1 Tax=Macrostomum lignano TaxID=282301 RepID=A0A1I8FNF0_9PLAT
GPALHCLRLSPGLSLFCVLKPPVHLQFPRRSPHLSECSRTCNGYAGAERYSTVASIKSALDWGRQACCSGLTARAAHSVETACPTGSQCTASSSNSSPLTPRLTEDPTSQDFEESRGLKAQQPPPPPAFAANTSKDSKRRFQLLRLAARSLTIFSAYVIAGLTFPLSSVVLP